MPVGLGQRMEGSGIVDRIQVTEDVVEKVGDRFPFVPREPIEIKAKGMTVICLLWGQAGVGVVPTRPPGSINRPARPREALRL